MLGTTEAFVKNTRTNTVRTRRSLQVITSLALLAVALSGGACDQPKIRCAATGGETAVRYKIVGDIPKACKDLGFPGTEGQAANMNKIGIETYVPVPTDEDAYNKKNALSLKLGWIGDRIKDARDHLKPPLENYPYKEEPTQLPPDTNDTNFPFTYGKFDDINPGAGNVCKLSAMTPSDMTYPAIPKHTFTNDNGEDETVDAQDETKVKYEFSNLRVIVSPDSIGTQTFADLTVTQDDCTLTYQVSLLYPLVDCGVTKGDKVSGDEKKCSAGATDENPFGSGIGEGIPVSCENIGTDADPSYACLPNRMSETDK